MSDAAPQTFFRKAKGSRKSGTLATTSFVVEPSDLPPVTSTRVSWTALLANRLQDLARAGAASGKPKGRMLPYASLRAVLQVGLPEAILLESDLGRPWSKEPKGAFLHLAGNDAAAAARQARRAIDAWVALILRPWATDLELGEEMVDSVAEAVQSGDALMTQVEIADLGQALREHQSFDRLRNPILQEISRRLEGLELFPGMGPVFRVIRSRSGGNEIEFQTWPKMAPKGGRYSMTATLVVGTVPYLDRPVVTVRASRRRWLDGLPKPADLYRQDELKGYLMGSGGAPIAVEFSAPLTKGVPSNPFSPEFMIQALRVRADLAMPLEGMIERHSDALFVGIAYASGRDGKHKVGSGATTRDQIDLFDAVAGPMRASGFRPLPFREIAMTPKRDPEYHKAIRSDAMIADFALSLGHNALDEEALFSAAQTLLENGDPPELPATTIEEARARLVEIRKANLDRVRRAFGEAKPTLVVVAVREDERRLMKAAIRSMFGNALDLEEQALPPGVHGARADLPKADRPAKERFAARVEAWGELSRLLSHTFGGCHALVQAADWYGNRKDDTVNKMAGRYALATQAEANAQYLLPCESWRGFEDYLHRIRSAVYDLLFGHSGLVTEIRSLLKADFPDPQTRPRAILGLSAVTQARLRGGGNAGQICLATRVDADSGKTTARIGWWDGAMMQRSRWEPFFDAMKRIAGLETATLGPTRDVSSRTFQAFTEAVIDEAAEVGDNPVVLIDATSATGLWPWLADTRISKPPFIGMEGMGKAEAWASVRIMRIRANVNGTPFGGRIIDRKTVAYHEVDPATGRVVGEVSRYSPTVTASTILVSAARTGQRHYWITGGYTQQVVRGLSVYRELETFTGVPARMATPACLERKGLAVRTAFGWYDAPYPVPNPIEVTVAHRAPDDDPDLLAHLVSSLRFGYGHTDASTVLPAPLFFEAKARDYMARFTIEDADGDGPEDDFNGTDGARTKKKSVAKPKAGTKASSILAQFPRLQEPAAEAGGVKSEASGTPSPDGLGTAGEDKMAVGQDAGEQAEERIQRNEGFDDVGEGLVNIVPDNRSALMPVPAFVTRDWLSGKFTLTAAHLRQIHEWRQELRDAAGFPWPKKKPALDALPDIVLQGLRYPLFVRVVSRILMRQMPTERKRQEYALFVPYRRSLNPAFERAESWHLVRVQRKASTNEAERIADTSEIARRTAMILHTEGRTEDAMAVLYLVTLASGHQQSYLAYARESPEAFAPVIPALESASLFLNDGFDWRRDLVLGLSGRSMQPPTPRDAETAPFVADAISYVPPAASGGDQASEAQANADEAVEDADITPAGGGATPKPAITELQLTAVETELSSAKIAVPVASVPVASVLDEEIVVESVENQDQPQAASPSFDAETFDAEQAMTRWREAIARIAALAATGRTSDPDADLVQGIARAAQEAREAQIAWEAAKPKLVDAWPIIGELRAILERLSNLKGAPDIRDVALIAAGPVLVSAAAAELAATMARKASGTLDWAAALVDRMRAITAEIAATDDYDRLEEVKEARDESVRQMGLVVEEIRGTDALLVTARDEAEALAGPVSAPRAAAAEPPPPSSAPATPEPAAHPIAEAKAPLSAEPVAVQEKPLFVETLEDRVPTEAASGAGSEPVSAMPTTAAAGEAGKADEWDDLDDEIETEEPGAYPEATTSRVVDLNIMPFPQPALPDLPERDPLAAQVDERLATLVGAGRFGLAYHLLRAAERVLPQARLGWSRHEFRLAAMHGHILHNSMQGSPLLDEVVSKAIEAVGALPKETEGPVNDAARARRILLGAACAELALFHPALPALQGVQALADAAPEIAEGSHALIEALTQAGRGLVTPALLRTIARDAEGSRYVDRCAEAVLGNIDLFSKIHFSFQPAARIRNNMHMRSGVVGRLKAGFEDSGDAAVAAAHEFQTACGDRDGILAALDTADEKSAKYRGLDGVARERMISAMSDLGSLCAEFLAAAEAVPNARDANRKARVQAIAQATSEGATRAIAALTAYGATAGPLSAAAAGFAIRAMEALQRRVAGDIIPVGLHDHLLAVHGDLLWLPGLHFGRSWLPCPYAPNQVVAVLLSHGLDEVRRGADTFAAAVRGRIQEGSFIAARLLLEASAFFGGVESDKVSLLEQWESESKNDLADLAGDETHIGKLEDARRLVMKLQRMGGLVKIDQAQSLLAALDRIDLAKLPALVPIEARNEVEEGEQILDICTARDAIGAVEDAVEAQLAGPKAALRGRLDGVVALGVPVEAIERVRRIIEDDEDLLTAGEYISFLENGADLPEYLSRNPRHDAFQRRVPEAVERMNKRGLDLARNALEEGTDLEALPYSRVPVERRGEATELLEGWRELRKQVEGNATSQHLAALLAAFLARTGIAATLLRVEGKAGVGPRKVHVTEMSLKLPTDPDSVLLPDFGSGTGGNYRVCLMPRSPSETDLSEICKREAEHYGVVVFVTAALTAEQRQQLAYNCITHNRRVLVIDEAILLYALSEPAFRPLTLFELAQPYSFADPYRDFGNAAVPREMFFGRTAEIRKVVDRNGSCIVYGGRRLGKTALLKHVQSMLNTPDGSGAAVGHANILDVGGAVLPSKVWEYASAALPTVFPQQVATATQFSHGVTRWLDADKRRRILLMLDEADAFIESDGENHFHEFLKLQSLMDKTGRLFKFVLAGLHNVTRLARTENPPLKHISADPLRIGPLLDAELEDAERLVTQPMEAMGYRFKNRSDIWRVLSHCNYYPVLVQTFCKGLLELLSKGTAQARKPVRDITERHIREALENRNIRREIEQKFEATIKIDTRYEFIACVIADRALQDQASGRSDEGMSDVEVLDAASDIRADTFASTNKLDAVRDLLDEMEGLGVLRLTAAGLWTLRSNAILRLLGDHNQILARMSDFIDNGPPAAFDPRSMRRPLRAPAGSKVASRVTTGQHCPLTLGQEHDLFLGDARIGVIFGNPLSDVAVVAEALLGAEPIAADGSPIRVVARAFRSVSDLMETIRDEAKSDRCAIVVDSRSNWSPNWIEQAVRQRGVKEGRVRLVLVGEPRHALDWVRTAPAVKLPPQVRILPLQPWSDALIRHELKRENLMGERLIEKLRLLTGGFNRPMSDAVRQGGTAERFEARTEKMAERLHKDPSLLAELGVLPQVAGAFRAIGTWADAATGAVTVREIAEYIQAEAADSDELTPAQIAEFGVLLALMEPQPLSPGASSDLRAHVLSPLLRTALANARQREAA